MARSFTVSALLSRIRLKTETENDDSVTDPFIQGELSTAYGELWSAVSGTGYRYFEKTPATPVVTAGPTPNIISEPADMYSLVGLDHLDPGGRRYPVDEVMTSERHWVNQPEFTGTRALAFDHVGAQIRLYPTPPIGQTYEILYIPQPTDLSAVAGGTLVDVVTPDGEAFLTAAVCVVVSDRKERDPRGFLAARAAAKDRLIEDALRRAFHQPRRQIKRDLEWDEVWSPGGWRMAPP